MENNIQNDAYFVQTHTQSQYVKTDSGPSCTNTQQPS